MPKWLTARSRSMERQRGGWWRVVLLAGFGLIFWSFVWGIWGTLLAVPMLVAVKACCDRIEDLKPVGELLGE